jgi:hypothetical protein
MESLRRSPLWFKQLHADNSLGTPRQVSWSGQRSGEYRHPFSISNPEDRVFFIERTFMCLVRLNAGADPDEGISKYPRQSAIAEGGCAWMSRSRPKASELHLRQTPAFRLAITLVVCGLIYSGRYQDHHRFKRTSLVFQKLGAFSDQRQKIAFGPHREVEFELQRKY